MPQDRPNILFLMSDEHRPDVTGYEGNTVIRTPVLDELARTGVVFRNAYTPSPICIPVRQAIMAGQFPRHCDCQRFGEDLAPGYMTWSRRLSQYGYSTICAGKLHHTGIDQMQGWTQRIAPDCHVSPRFIEGRRPDAADGGPKEAGQGKWTNQKEIERAGIMDGRYQRFDRNVVQQTIQWVEDHLIDPTYDRPHGKNPICLKVSLLQPHYPFFTSRELFNYYLNRVPIYQDDRADHPLLARTQCGPDVDATPRDIRRATAAYYGMVETVDTYCGQVMQALEDAGEDLDEWIIVYTTDHGEMLGQHGVWEKTSFYEASARVPLIIRWPKRFKPTDIEQNVNLCDLFATFCDLAGLETPPDLDSRSLVPLMDGDASNWDNETVSQMSGSRIMIKQDHLKYMCFSKDDVPEVLFDLNADPDELENQIHAPQYADALTRLRARRDELGFQPKA